MTKTLAALCGAALIAGCSSVPSVQRVESNSSCDWAYMARVEAQWQPTYIQRNWVNCPQVRPDARKS
jgi:hypothetical protein